MRLRRSSRLPTRPAARLILLVVLATILSAVLTARLAWVQLASHARLAEAAVSQRAQVIPLSPTRGAVLDRTGVSLTGSRLSYTVAVYANYFPAGSRQVSMLAAALGLSPSAVEARLDGRCGPVYVARGVPPGTARRLGEIGLEGLALIADEVRYGADSVARHVVGYAGQSGQAGLEEAWDSILAGRGPEFLALFVDGRGEAVESLGWRKLYSSAGGSPLVNLPCDIVTTLDVGVQRVVEEVMDRRVARGAIVVMDPWTGDVLAMGSRPDFDQARIDEELERTDGCLLNRALVAYPPGSAFKPVVMAAALEEGAVHRADRFACAGTVAADGREIACPAHSGRSDTEITLAEGLTVSCNTVFVRLWERLGQDALREWAARFGFGRGTFSGLPGEETGSLPPTQAEKLEPDAAFGQGTVEVTPLQMACFFSAVANGGRSVFPRLVREVRSPAGTTASLAAAGPGRRERVMSEATAAQVAGALVAAVRDGTGRAAAVAPDVAGKTGTAETGRRDHSGRALHDAWFAGFWPAVVPRYVIVVVVEDTQAGGAHAASIFGEVLGGLRSRGS